jgi:ATP-dependent Lon protease
MSGEISLRGHILPVGGVREKVLAAHRAAISRILLPHQNRKDIHELTPKVRGEITFIWCETVEQLLAEALVDDVAGLGKKPLGVQLALDAPPEADDSPQPLLRAPSAVPQPLLTHASKL